MKELLADLYRILYKITGIPGIALILTLGYITTLNFLILHALIVLLAEMVPSFALGFFSFPYNIAVFAVLFFLAMWMMQPVRVINKDKEHIVRYTTIVLYTVIAIVSYLYLSVGTKITN